MFSLGRLRTSAVNEIDEPAHRWLVVSELMIGKKF